MRAQLLIYRNKEYISSVMLDPIEKTVIGRHPACTINFNDSRISSQHCSIEIKGNYFYIIDQDSTNGTYVNGTRIRVRRLYSGDTIRCGDIEFHFECIVDEDSEDITFSELDSQEEADVLVMEEPEEENRDRIGDYLIIEKIGQGGIGEVYKAEHILTRGHYFAIKVLTPTAQKDSTLVERFLREAQACMLLDHPRIIKVFEIGCYKNRPFFVMEYVQGKPLDKFLRPKGPLDPIIALKIAGHIAHALSYAHSYNIIHRDLKPSNILIEDKGHHMKLIDLGLAKMLDQSSLTVTHHLIGTPRYMAPEQMRNPNAIDFRVDIYSLGAVIYRMITGMVPYAEIISENRSTLLRYMYSKSPVPIEEIVDVPGPIISLVQKAMAKRKETRFSSAQEMFEEIHRTIQWLNQNESERL